MDISLHLGCASSRVMALYDQDICSFTVSFLSQFNRDVIFPPFGGFSPFWLKFLKTKVITFDPICQKITSFVRGWGVFLPLIDCLITSLQLYLANNYFKGFKVVVVGGIWIFWAAKSYLYFIIVDISSLSSRNTTFWSSLYQFLIIQFRLKLYHCACNSSYMYGGKTSHLKRNGNPSQHWDRFIPLTN